MVFSTEAQARAYAEAWCVKNECRYLSHEYIRHSHDRWSWLHIAIESGEGRCIVKLDLHKEHA